MKVKSIVIEKTYSTPEVNFDFDKGLFSLKGRSIPEDSIGFYEPLIEGINQYSESPQKSTIVNIQLDYFNTNSDDDDMREVGEDLHKMLKSDFNIIKVEEE